MKFKSMFDWKSKAGGLVIAGCLVSTAALAAGLYTNGMPIVAPNTSNGVAAVAPNGVVTQLTSRMLSGVDTLLTGGSPPQTVAATTFQIFAQAAELAANTATSTAGAATMNVESGTITTEALTTAPGATYTFTLTDSVIAAGAVAPQVAMYSKSNYQGAIQVNSVTNAVGGGSSVFVFQNTGATAFNGTMVIAFHL